MNLLLTYTSRQVQRMFGFPVPGLGFGHYSCFYRPAGPVSLLRGLVLDIFLASSGWQVQFSRSGAWFWTFFLLLPTGRSNTPAPGFVFGHFSCFFLLKCPVLLLLSLVLDISLTSSARQVQHSGSRAWFFDISLTSSARQVQRYCFKTYFTL